MNHQKSRISDDDNTFFELPNPSLENIKPGLDLDEKKGTVELKGHNRFHNRKKIENIPQLPLAERISKAKKGK
jgi:hypothetical protein